MKQLNNKETNIIKIKIGEIHMIVDKKGNLFEDRRKNKEDRRKSESNKSTNKVKNDRRKADRRKEDNKIKRK